MKSSIGVPGQRRLSRDYKFCAGPNVLSSFKQDKIDPGRITYDIDMNLILPN